MKPAPFQYVAPDTLEEVLTLLAEHADDATLLAGGQSLVPAMNFRLAQPAVLIDLNRVSQLAYVRSTEDYVRLGAMTRQSAVERSAVVRECSPLLHQTMPWIAHPQIRNRGTIGGSVAHADPAAELPAVMVALGARFLLKSLQGERWVSAGDFFAGMFTTVREAHELLVDIEIPRSGPRTGHDFQEVARRHGDYAMVGVATVLSLDPDQHCTDALITLLSVGEGVVSARLASEFLQGGKLNSTRISEAARMAAYEEIEPLEDIHASVDFKRHLAEVLIKRALVQARERALGREDPGDSS